MNTFTESENFGKIHIISRTQLLLFLFKKYSKLSNWRTCIISKIFKNSLRKLIDYHSNVFTIEDD